MGANMHNLYADRKNGRAPIEVLHPALTDKLADTYQIMVYQEQVMSVAQEMAGYSMVDADNLRRAMGKKIKSVMKAEEEKFVAGQCRPGARPRRWAVRSSGSSSTSSGYGFNKSHSSGYGLVAYQTAFLKAHHPAEYLAALLTATKKDKDRTAVYLNECRQMGIEVLVPDVNESDSDFTVQEGRIRFGLSAVRNVGEGVVEKIVEARADGAFNSFHDFVDRVDVSALNKRTVESLIKAGAFDAMGYPRKGLTVVYEQILDGTLERRRNEEMGQFSLFAGEPGEVSHGRIDVPDLVWPQKIRLAFEKEMLGLYVSDHPLLSIGQSLAAATTTTVSRARRVVRQDERDSGRSCCRDHPSMDQERRPDDLLPTRGPRRFGGGRCVPPHGQRLRACRHR